MIDVALQRVTGAGENLANDRPTRLGAMAKVHKPLLIPHAIERDAGDRRYGGGDVRAAKSAEPVLLGRTDIRIAGIERCPDGVENEKGDEVGLKEYILSRESAPITAGSDVTRHRIKLQNCAGIDPVLDLLIGQRIGHEILAGQVRIELLIDRLRAEESRQEHQLRTVRPYGVAGIRAAKEKIWSDRAVVISGSEVSRHRVELGGGLDRDRIRGVVAKGDVAQERRPVHFDQFRAVCRARERGRGRHHDLQNLVGRRRGVTELPIIGPFEGEGIRAHGAIFRPGSACDDILPVLKPTTVNCSSKTSICRQVDQSDPILQQAFGVSARLVGVALLIAVRVVRRDWDGRFLCRRLDPQCEGLLCSRV